MQTNKGNFRYDIQSANLDLYIMGLLANITEQQRSLIPDDIASKLHKARKTNAFNLNGVGFGQKAYLLSAVFGRRVVIFCSGSGGDEETVGVPDLKKGLKVSKGKGNILGFSEELYTEGHFVLGDKDLMDALSFARLICATDLYRAVIPAAKRIPTSPSKFEEHRAAYKGVVSLFLNYEANKKRIPIDYGFTIAEWYTLLHFTDSEKKGPTLYNGRFKFAHGSSRPTLKTALMKLTQNGYLIARGKTLQRHYSLSAKGEQAMQNIFEKLILNQIN